MKAANVSRLMEGKDKAMSTRDVADRCDCSQTTVRRLIEKDKLPCFFVGNQYRVLESDVIKCFTLPKERKKKKPDGQTSLGEVPGTQ